MSTRKPTVRSIIAWACMQRAKTLFKLERAKTLAAINHSRSTNDTSWITEKPATMEEELTLEKATPTKRIGSERPMAMHLPWKRRI